MSQLAAQTFVADTKVVIVLTQAMTDSQNNALGEIRRNAVLAGESVSTTNAQLDPETGVFTYTSFYDHPATGAAIANTANTFTPAPTSVTVTAV